jgi:hypothetical protein
MLHPQAFLLEECENVASLLRNTLRYAYSSKSSGDVYTECFSRLKLIQSRILAAKPNQNEKLNELAIQLSELSVLIGRVERSHIEEFSWPVAIALQDLAGTVCGTTKISGANETPLFFISAEDELFSYEVITEEDDPGLIVRPLFNIIFPRSLKHFVLLHPILAHEIGHAAYAIPDLGARLQENITNVLIEGSPLQDRAKFEEWLKNSGQSLTPDELDYALLLWPEELFCDLFGLLLGGPSFVGANATLLQPFGPDVISDSHPASVTRYWMTHEIVNFLEWRLGAIGKRKAMQQPVQKYFGDLERIGRRVPQKLRLLRPPQVRKATSELIRLLGDMGNALFKMPHAADLELMVESLLRARPPTESKVKSDLSTSNDDVDFRSILFAGWLAWNSEKKTRQQLNFLNMNLLCDRGVLQQAAVDRWTKKRQQVTKDDSFKHP